MVKFLLVSYVALLAFITSAVGFGSVQINFQPDASSVPVGYLKDSGEAWGDRGNGFHYGWQVDITDQTRDRNRNSNQVLDTLCYINSSASELWEITVPDGNYLVTVVIGDSRYANTGAIDIEGAPFIPSTSLAVNEFVEETKYCTVSDGRLTLSEGAGGSDTRINSIRIQEVTDAPEFPRSEVTLALVPGSPENSIIGRVAAFDHQGDSIEYSLVGSVPFTVDASGDIRNSEVLDYNAIQSYAFQVSASDGINSSTVDVTAQFVQSSGVLLDRWVGISGSSVSDLTASDHYQNEDADYSYVIDTLDVADAGMSNFGQKLTAVLVPTQTGSYTFGLASDDSSEVRVSMSGQTQDLVLLAELNGWTSYQNWTKVESSSIELLAGHAYYIEILHKEGSGGDHVSLGWKLEGASAYALIPSNELYQGYLSLEMTKPLFAEHQTDYLIAGATSIGETVAVLPATDLQGDDLDYAIVGSTPFVIDDQGVITISESLPIAGADYSFDVTVTDGTHVTVTTLMVRTTAATAANDAVISGSVDAVTAEELIDAALAEIDAGQDLLLATKRSLFNLNSDGSAKADGSSLTDIDWNPTHDTGVLASAYGLNTPVLLTNAVTNEGYDVVSREVGIIGEIPGKFLVLGSNPMRNFYRDATSVNTDMHQFLENSIAWLAGRDDLKTNAFSVAIAHLDQSYYFPDEVAVRTWLDTHYPSTVSYNVADSIDDGNLSAALALNPDLLIISQKNGIDPDTIANTVEAAMEAGIGVLYLHHDGNQTPLGSALFSVFNVSYAGDNYWRRLQLVDYDVTSVDLQALPEGVLSIQTMLSHLKADEYAFDWSLADGSDVSGVTGLQSMFLEGASEVRSMMNELDEATLNVFESDLFRFEKLIALLGDSYRRDVIFPMDKTETDDARFLQSYYADHAAYYSRLINPAQPNMGNFSRSDFSHIMPVTKTVDMESKKNFRSAGVYALPGQTVRITRLDTSDLEVEIYVNTQRSGSTHQWDSWGYSRPKYLKSPQLPIESGATIEFTTPYGGPVQVAFSANDLPVQLRFENVGEHPYWRGSSDDVSFAQKMDAGEYDWAEIATPAFEVHSALLKMRSSVEEWGTPQLLSEATMRYMHNFPHVLAGFQGPGIDVVPEVHDFAAANGWTINTLDLVKHMNADQATCGYGCSGNPYDAYWDFSPIGHGDIHELGHGLEVHKFRMPGWEGHSVTNPYSYYSKTQYYKDTGNDPDCQSLPFESVFDALQASVLQADPSAWLQENLWASSGWSQQFMMLLQIMMLAENEGALEDGWHVYSRLHMLNREFGRSDDDDAVWLAKRDTLGFSSYTREEARAISNTDWMVIAVSYVTGLDYRDFFSMYGYAPSGQADAQVASFAYPVVPQAFCLSTAKGYCKGQGFNAMVLPVDGVQVWPAETDTDEDQQWDYFDDDDDGDAMPDAYEIENGFNPLEPSDASQNADGDRMDNVSEYIAGTLPRDRNSQFKFSQIQHPLSGGVELQWFGVEGRRYSVWGTDDLGADFLPLRGAELSAGGTETFTDRREGIPAFFYKVEVEFP